MDELRGELADFMDRIVSIEIPDEHALFCVLGQEYIDKAFTPKLQIGDQTRGEFHGAPPEVVTAIVAFVPLVTATVQFATEWLKWRKSKEEDARKEEKDREFEIGWKQYLTAAKLEPTLVAKIIDNYAPELKQRLERHKKSR